MKIGKPELNGERNRDTGGKLCRVSDSKVSAVANG